MLIKFIKSVWRTLAQAFEEVCQAEIEHQKWRSQYIKKYGVDPCPEHSIDFFI